MLVVANRDIIDASTRFEPVEIINFLKMSKPTTCEASANQAVTQSETGDTRTNAETEKRLHEVIMALQNEIKILNDK